MSIVMINVRKKMQKIAVVEMFGTIGGQIKSPAYERVFSAIEKDDKIKAMVLDIDSPGGGVSESDNLYRSVAKVAAKKPVIASIRGVGASGAYYISCAAQKIVATHSAIIGSIGVISVRPALQELLQRIGVGVNVNKSGQFKDMGAFWREPTPQEEQKMQALIDDSYGVFVSIVANARKMDEGTVRSLATGEVFWASKAQALGLVDELGDLARSIDLAVELSGAPRNPVFMTPRRGLRERLFGGASASLVESVADQIEHRLWNSSLRY